MAYTWADVSSGQTASATAINALGNQVEALSATPTWTSLGFSNGCSSYGGLYVAGYYLDPVGRMWLKGLVKVGSGGLAPAAVAATFPANLAPAGQVLGFNRINASSNLGTGRIDVQNTGQIINNSGVALDSGAWLVIDGLTWMPGQ